MNGITKNDKDAILKMTGELVDSINNLSDSLPKNLIYDLDDRLKLCVRDVPAKIAQSLDTKDRINKIRCMITIEGSLRECADYLNLIRHLRYDDTKELIGKVRHVKDLLSEQSFSETAGVN